MPSPRTNVPGAWWTRPAVTRRAGHAPRRLDQGCVAIVRPRTSVPSNRRPRLAITSPGWMGQGQGWCLPTCRPDPPGGMARTAIAASRSHRADRVVAEVNNGRRDGPMRRAQLIDPKRVLAAVRPPPARPASLEPRRWQHSYEQGPGCITLGVFPAPKIKLCGFCAADHGRFRPPSHWPASPLNRAPARCVCR